MKKKAIVFLLRCCLWRVALWWCRSLRITIDEGEKVSQLRSSGRNYVVAFWHGSMLIGWFLHRPQKSKAMSALVSQSKDGEYLSTVLEKWGYTLIRGSSHIGGKEAMQLMTEEVMNGNSLAITPDGPRGPRHEMKMGAIRVAQKTSVPLVLVGIAMKKKRNLKSWDSFEVPAPFSRIHVVYSDPIIVPIEVQGDPLNELKESLQQKMVDLTQRVEKGE